MQGGPSRRSKTTSAQFQSEVVATMLTLDEEAIWQGRNYGSCIFAVRLVTIGVRFVTEKQECLVTNILTVDTCRKTKVLLILQHMQGATCFYTCLSEAELEVGPQGWKTLEKFV